tara:strand:- start:2544 stop:3890 length:1347 start_codon:yes stop_codon:yes gene_type:complete
MAAETIQDIRDKAKAIADSVEITENQKKALLEAAEAAAKLKVATTAISVGQKAVNTIFSESVEALNTLEGAQVTLAATIGQQAVPAVETAKNVFNEFNLAVRGISFDQISQALGSVRQQFNLTAIATDLGKGGLDELAKSIALNANVIESSKLAEFTKTLAFQNNMATDTARKFGEQLVETAVQVGLPREALLNLSRDLLNSGVIFGSSGAQIEQLTFRTEAFGRALGTTGAAIRGQLEGMMTINQRQQLAARLSQIGAMVGARVDIAKLMSADPAVQQEGIQETLQAFSSQYNQLDSPVRKRALFLALSRSLRLPAQAVQAALERGVSVSDSLDKLNQERSKAEAGISQQTRDVFTKMTDRLDQLVKNLRLQSGEAQLIVLNEALKALTGQNKQTGDVLSSLEKNLVTSGKKSQEFLDRLGKLFGKQIDKLEAQAKANKKTKGKSGS